MSTTVGILKRLPHDFSKGNTVDENAGGPRSVGAAVARPCSRRRTRRFVVEYENEHDDEEDFHRSAP